MGNRLDNVARELGIRLALQFGSTVKGSSHGRSDVDVAVLLERADVSLREYGDLVQAFQELFPGHEVDLAIINRADPLFLQKITENCRILYGSPGDLQRLSIYAFKRYQDHKKYFAMEREFTARALGPSSRQDCRND